MKLIAVADKSLLSQKDWSKVAGGAFSDIVFVSNKDILTFDYNFSKEDKTLLLDPDYFDWNFPHDVLKQIKNLKYVVLTTTTASYVDEKYLEEKKIKLLTVPKYSTNSVAEYLVFLMMCLAKKLPLQLKSGNKQDFSGKFLQIELTGKTCGVVGFGNIGQRVCEIVEGIGMRPIYYNRTQKESKYKAVELKELFKTADVIFLTLANNPQTRKLVTDELLRSMKSTAILISGTGIALHNDSVVKDMLKRGKLFGFGAELPNACDVVYDGNVMITSEYAWFTKEAGIKRQQIIVENLLSIK